MSEGKLNKIYREAYLGDHECEFYDCDEVDALIAEKDAELERVKGENERLEAEVKKGAKLHNLIMRAGIHSNSNIRLRILDEAWELVKDSALAAKG